MPISERVLQGKPLPGLLAAWVFIYIAFLEFTFFFAVFLVAKATHTDDFHQHTEHLNLYAGLANTLVLITSSLFVALAMQAIKEGNRNQCLLFFYLTMFCGLTYIGIKGYEYLWNQEMGITVRANPFYAVYYYITFNHLLHVLTGTCLMGLMILCLHLNVFDRENHEGLESAACYWHMIDLIWIIIFPLVYVLR